MGWLRDWVLRTFFANQKDPQMWWRMLELLVGPQVCTLIVNVVQAVEQGKIPVVVAVRAKAAAEPTGPDKKAAATSAILAQLEQLGIQLATVLLNLAIEIAVSYLRSKTGGLV